ncbi:hypothetical protein BH10CHL1_BH10CHL1_01050 [soil metagenome]
MTENSIQVLLIEDDDVDREVVHRLLRNAYVVNATTSTPTTYHAPYLVHDASTGAQALKMLQALQPDCVLLDYRLPDMDGFEVLSVCVRQNVPVVVLTGEESPEIIVKAMQQGAQDYLVKDHISRASLDHAVTNAIEKVALRIALEEKQQRLVIQAADLEEKNQQVRELASALTLAEQRERRRISQILHDNVQQMLYGVQMRAHLIGLDAEPGAQSEVQGHVEEIDFLVKAAIQATRTLTVELSPPVLKDEGISTVFRWLASQMQETHALQVELDCDDSCQAPNEDLRVLLFQLVREVLFNIVKHANTLQACLKLFEQNDEMVIEVTDNGKGFDAEAVARMRGASGFGLYSVRERLALFGGRLEIHSIPGDGTSVKIVTPLKQA